MLKKIERTQVDSLNIHGTKLKGKNWSSQEIQIKNQTSLGSGLLKWKNQFDQDKGVKMIGITFEGYKNYISMDTIDKIRLLICE